MGINFPVSQTVSLNLGIRGIFASAQAKDLYYTIQSQGKEYDDEGNLVYEKNFSLKYSGIFKNIESYQQIYEKKFIEETTISDTTTNTIYKSEYSSGYHYTEIYTYDSSTKKYTVSEEIKNAFLHPYARKFASLTAILSISIKL